MSRTAQSAKVIHRNVRPTWYGVVLAKHMQDPTMTSELKALIAVVSTFPRENWKWRGEFLRSMLNWGRERWQRVIREAKTLGFVTIAKVSDGKSIQTEYGWNIERPKRASRVTSVHRSVNPTNGAPVERAARPLNDAGTKQRRSKEQQRTG